MKETQKDARISVVIPAHNEAGYIGRTLARLKEIGEEPRLEVILSDDGSTDGTPDMAQDLADLVVRPSPGDRTGPGAARNRGAARARGGILVFLDADSLVLAPPFFFRLILRAFRDKSLVGATSRLSLEPGRAGWAERVVLLAQDLIIMAENLVGIHVAGGWCQIVKKEAFEKIGGYDESLSVSQDVDLFRRLGALGKTRLIPGLRVCESPRRYREKGLTLTYLIRIRNSLLVLLGARPRGNGYRESRPEFH